MVVATLYTNIGSLSSLISNISINHPNFGRTANGRASVPTFIHYIMCATYGDVLATVEI